MNWDGRPVLVTGGASFIGSHLVDKLIELNHKVVVIDNESANETKPKEDVVNAERLEYRDASACDLVLLKSLGG